MTMAFPNGAGGCPEGRPAVDALHIREYPNRTIQTGSLRDGGLELEIHGISLFNLDEDTLALPVGVPLTWTLKTTARPFRGFLLRVNGGDNNIDTRGALLPHTSSEPNTTTTDDDNNNVTQAQGICLVYHGVGGVCHTNNQEKQSVSGILYLDDASTNLQLDVTVVIENRYHSSIYYYSGFRLDALVPLQTSTTCNATHPCGRCEGDCSRHSDCETGLECYIRPGVHTSHVPGCYGRGVPGYDYCYEPRQDTLRLRETPCSASHKCGKCEGDCSSNRDCEGNLKCFHRRSYEIGPVPGCEGQGIRGKLFIPSLVLNSC
jgi:hypothetical protein